MKKIVSLVLIVAPTLLKAQDSIPVKDSVKLFNFHQEPLARKSLGSISAIPVVLIGYGAASLAFQGLKNVNAHFKEEIYLERTHKPFHLDNYLQYAPGALVYGLNIVGIKGKHNFVDRTAIYVMSGIIMSGTVMATKKLTQEWRPDRSDQFSFPSGHTANAFAAAEFLRQEYKDVSPWYGVAGYAMAATTGYLRMYNNKHWFGDVVAGAGVGILSTDLAYYIYPSVKKLFVNKKTNGTTIIMPTYQQRTVGISLVHLFN
jgi:hypothetical protein